MDKSEINRWVEGFVTDLMFGSEGVPLERVIATRLDGFVSLRDHRLTWRAIAALVARAGGRRRDGKPISGDQLRAVVARLTRRRSAVQARQPPLVRRQRTQLPVAGRSASPGTGRQSKDPPPFKLADATDKDVSTDEIAAALARIKKKV